MWRVLNIVAVTVFALGAVATAQERPVTFYVQLIRGTDSEQPPEAGSKLIGTKLAGTLRCLKWRHYLEIHRREVEVDPGQLTRVALRNGREAEIDLRSRTRRTVAAFKDGKLLDRTSVPTGDAMTLIGGDRDRKTGWFIVVRRDRPGN